MGVSFLSQTITIVSKVARKFFIVIFLLAICLPSQAKTDTIAIAILSQDPEQMAVYSNYFTQFEQRHPEVSIKLDFYSDASYKAKINDWLELGQYDLFYWQSGRRLTNLVENDLLMPIDELLAHEQTHKTFLSGVMKQLEYKGVYYAIPVAQYGWGFFYNKSIFLQNGFKEPQSWQQFLTLCHNLKQKGIFPLIQAQNEYWPLLAWVDYLSLELGGNEMRGRLVTSTKVSESIAEQIQGELAKLIDNQYFFAPDYNWDWSQTIPALIRKQAAMTLMGQFAEGGIPQSLSDEIGYFSFPFSPEKNGTIEIAPLDVWVVGQTGKNTELFQHLLRYLADPKVNESLALELGLLPVTADFDVDSIESERVRKGALRLFEANELVQYFDRDAQVVFSDNLAKSMQEAFSKQQPDKIGQALRGGDFSPSDKSITEQLAPKRQMVISTITGSRGSFLLSSLIRLAYERIGYDVSVTRKNSNGSGEFNYQLDAELARPMYFATQHPKLIRVEEPLADFRMFLICKEKENCDADVDLIKSLNDKSVGVLLDSTSIKSWFDKIGANQQRFNLGFKMWQAFETDKLDYLLVSEVDAVRNLHKLKDNGYRVVLEMTLYHYLNKQHANLALPLKNALQRIKKTDFYYSLLESYRIPTH